MTLTLIMSMNPIQIRNQRYIALGAALAIFAQVPHAEPASLPRFDAALASVAYLERDLVDPTLSFGATYDELSDEDRALFDGPFQDHMRESLLYHRAALHLVEGRLSLFTDSLVQLDQAFDGVPDESRMNMASSVAYLYAWAIEAGVTRLDLNLFRTAISRLPQRDDLGYSYTHDLAKLVYAYAINDDRSVDRWIETSDGYIRNLGSVLAVKLNPTARTIARAVEFLEAEWEEVAPVGFRAGRVALQLATVYRLQAGTLEPERREGVLRKARRFAAIARTQLEKLESPLMWAAAHRETAEILELVLEQIRLDDMAIRPKIEARLERAREFGNL